MIKYYTLDKILEYKADYNLIIGERSNGKTTAVLMHCLKQYVESNKEKEFAIIRRFQEDFKGNGGQKLFSGLVDMGYITKLTKKQYNNVYYYANKWYLTYTDESGKVKEKSETPFAYAFSIASEEHYKSVSYPKIINILFDEFLTRGYYLPDEFVKFQSLLSTIIRLKDNVKIFMCANTINKYAPYFAEMGLTKIKEMKKGVIDIYEYGESGLRVAVEYSDFETKKKASNKYFAFDNPKLKMITNGSWEIDIYPHLPYSYCKKDILYTYFIVFDNITLQCELIYNKANNYVFTFIHAKTTEIKDNKNEIVFSTQITPQNRNRINITKPSDKITLKIYQQFLENKVYYQSNEIGEVVNNYLKWCNNK